MGYQARRFTVGQNRVDENRIACIGRAQALQSVLDRGRYIEPAFGQQAVQFVLDEIRIPQMACNVQDLHC